MIKQWNHSRQGNVYLWLNNETILDSALAMSKQCSNTLQYGYEQTMKQYTAVECMWLNSKTILDSGYLYINDETILNRWLYELTVIKYYSMHYIFMNKLTMK